MKRLGAEFSVLLSLCSLLSPSTAVRVIGAIDYNANPFQYYYLSRFGVAAGSSMYVFGTVNRTLKPDRLIPLNSQMLLVFIPQSVTNDLLQFISENQNDVTRSICARMIPAVLNESISVDGRCTSGPKDYLRKVPCKNGTIMSCNQPNSTSVITGNDFTYIRQAPDTEYYYLFLLSCQRNSTATCMWSKTEEPLYFNYDISLVNANPENNLHLDPFTYQFPYDTKGVLILLIVYTIAYALVITTHVLLHTRLCVKQCKMHRLPAIFTVSLFLDFFHVAFEMIHMAVYASDGIGAVWCNYLGEICNQFSDWLLILVLLLIGRGWMITTSALRSKKITFTLWGAYVFFFAIYFVWTVLQDQVYPLSITTQHTFQSWPGGFYLAYRLFLLLCILYEMRHVYLVENRPEKLKLYVVLAIFYILWFCYLPGIVFVAALINPVLKYKLVLSFVLTFDFLANFGMVLLFVPRWSKLFFQFDSHLNALQESPYKSLKSFRYGSSENTPNVV